MLGGVVFDVTVTDFGTRGARDDGEQAAAAGATSKHLGGQPECSWSTAKTTRGSSRSSGWPVVSRPATWPGMLSFALEYAPRTCGGVGPVNQRRRWSNIGCRPASGCVTYAGLRLVEPGRVPHCGIDGVHGQPQRPVDIRQCIARSRHGVGRLDRIAERRRLPNLGGERFMLSQHDSICRSPPKSSSKTVAPLRIRCRARVVSGRAAPADRSCADNSRGGAHFNYRSSRDVSIFRCLTLRSAKQICTTGSVGQSSSSRVDGGGRGSRVADVEERSFQKV